METSNSQGVPSYWYPGIGIQDPLEWPANCLRHSFDFYHLAHYKDTVQTAFLMGTSPRLLYETYANQVSRRDAAKWWEL